jgi:hypothetical protein
MTRVFTIAAALICVCSASLASAQAPEQPHDQPSVAPDVLRLASPSLRPALQRFDPATPNLGTREDRLPPIAFFSPLLLAGGLPIRAPHTRPPVSAFATFNPAYNFADDSNGVASG